MMEEEVRNDIWLLIILRYLSIDYTLNEPEYNPQWQQSQQSQQNTIIVSNPSVDPIRDTTGGNVSIASTERGQIAKNSQPSQSRYPQRERIAVTRTNQRATSNIYAFRSPLSQDDEDNEEPIELRSLKVVPRNYQSNQLPSTIPPTKTEERKACEASLDSVVNQFFNL